MSLPRGEGLVGTAMSVDSGVMVLGQSRDQEIELGGMDLRRWRFWRWER